MCERLSSSIRRRRSQRLCFAILIVFLLLFVIWFGVRGPPWFFPFRVSTLKSCAIVYCVFSCLFRILSELIPLTLSTHEYKNDSPCAYVGVGSSVLGLSPASRI